MTFHQRWILAVSVLACLPHASCRKMEVEQEAAEHTAATVVHQEEKHPDQPARITLTEDARKRIDVQTTPIQEIDVNGAKQKVLPFSALFYAPNGDTWTFTNTEPLTYVRERISVDRIDGDKAFLAKGPAAGTQVVTVGASLLYGSENEFEEE